MTPSDHRIGVERHLHDRWWSAVYYFIKALFKCIHCYGVQYGVNNATSRNTFKLYINFMGFSLHLIWKPWYSLARRRFISSSWAGWKAVCSGWADTRANSSLAKGKLTPGLSPSHTQLLRARSLWEQEHTDLFTLTRLDIKTCWNLSFSKAQWNSGNHISIFIISQKHMPSNTETEKGENMSY